MEFGLGRRVDGYIGDSTCYELFPFYFFKSFERSLWFLCLLCVKNKWLQICFSLNNFIRNKYDVEDENEHNYIAEGKVHV